MSHVVTSVCLGCRCGSCARMCPVAAFRLGREMLLIDPDSCIDCEACRMVCHRGAIFPQDHVPKPLSQWVEINRQEARKLPVCDDLDRYHGFPAWRLEA